MLGFDPAILTRHKDRGENDFRLLGLRLADLPRVSSGLVQRGLSGTPIDADEQDLVPEHCRFGSVAANDPLACIAP